MKFSQTSALLLSALMITSFVGCGEKKEDSSSKAESVAENSVSETESTTAAEETTSAEKEAVTEAPTEHNVSLENLSTFTVNSDDLHDGVWDSIITNTQNGSNVSPQLSWDAVDGAESYVIYMLDENASNYIHWKSFGITETTLPQGWASEEEYIGPYPPSTHTYDVYVFAVRETPTEIDGYFDGSNTKFFEKLGPLDTDSNGETGNILSYGIISGTYTCGD